MMQNKKTVDIHIRLTPEEKEKLEKAAEKDKRTLSGFLRIKLMEIIEEK